MSHLSRQKRILSNFFHFNPVSIHGKDPGRARNIILIPRPSVSDAMMLETEVSSLVLKGDARPMGRWEDDCAHVRESMETL